MKKQAKKERQLDPDLSQSKAIEKCSDPLLSLFNPLKYFGSISETKAAGIDSYTKKDCQYIKYEKHANRILKRKYKPIEPETFKNTYYMKYMKSLVHPGENVGTIAA